MAAGVAAHQANRLDLAEQIYRAVLQVYPGNAEAQNMLGMVLYQQGRFPEALPWVEGSVRIDPQQSAFWSNLGMVLAAVGQRERAAASIERAVRIDPNQPHAQHNLGTMLVELGRFAEAEQAFRRAIELKPDMVQAYRGLGSLLETQLDWTQAADCYRRVLEITPDHVDTLCSLGSTLHSLGRLEEAEQVLRRALELAPDRAEIVARLAVLRQAEGAIDEAVALHGRAVQLAPSVAWIHSGYLMCLQYRPGITPRELAREHAEFDRRHAAPLRSQWRPHDVDRDPDRPLRLGFVSLDFGFHTVGILAVRMLEGLRRQSCEIFCYSDRAKADPFTFRFTQAAHVWRQIESLSDEALAEQIRADRIDVLFEMAGHTPRNRLLALARKPAPIQVTWLGYVGTTGLEAIDYILADPRQTPPDAEEFYRERVLRLPDDYATFDPFPTAPEVGPLPAERTGRVTFGSLNNPAKINREVIALWAKILDRVPGSRLLLRYRGIEGRVRQLLADRFAAEGIASDRLELLPAGRTIEMYAQYNQIDVGLDPFPYSGGLTTIEALWMGVPTVTLPGLTFAGRHALAHLTAVGLRETIARDPEHYVTLAVSLAEDRPRLAGLRAGLRERVARSALCDGDRAAAHLHGLLREAWRDWLRATGRR